MGSHIVLIKSAEPAALVGWSGVSEFEACLSLCCFHFPTDVGAEIFTAEEGGRSAIFAAVVCPNGEVGRGRKVAG